MTQRPVPTDDELKLTMFEAAQLQTQVLRWALNVGTVILALALCVVGAWAGDWVIESIGG